jgi:hypothetical protein
VSYAGGRERAEWCALVRSHHGGCYRAGDASAEQRERVMSDYDDDTLSNRFDLYGALWAFCARWHSGMESRGYRILSRLSRAGYSPGIGLQAGRFESEQQRWIYEDLVRGYRAKV